MGINGIGNSFRTTHHTRAHLPPHQRPDKPETQCCPIDAPGMKGHRARNPESGRLRAKHKNARVGTMVGQYPELGILPSEMTISAAFQFFKVDNITDLRRAMSKSPILLRLPGQDPGNSKSYVPVKPAETPIYA